MLDDESIRLLIVQGPSGCGKTTLVRSWEPTTKLDSIIWVSLSTGMDNRSSFWQHVSSSAVRLGELTEDMIAAVEQQMLLTADPVRIAAALITNVGAVTLVIDAYEHVGDAQAETDADIARLLESAPGLRVILTTRAPTALIDAPLGDGGTTRVITVKDLAFTPDEIASLLEIRTGSTDLRVADSIARATRGFGASVRAVILTLAQLGHVPRADSVEWSRIVGARMESLLPGPEAVQFVTDTSVPPYFDVDLGVRLSNMPNAHEVLEMLERNGFGRWIPYAAGAPVFQYVESIRDTFRKRAQLDPERFREACITSAKWLLKNEEVVEQALMFAIEGEDYALADRMYVEVVTSNPDAYTTDRFLRTLQAVPEACLAKNPMLAFGLSLAMAVSPTARGESARIAEIAARATVTHGYVTPELDPFVVASMRAIALRVARKFREAADAAVVALRLWNAIPVAIDPGLQGSAGIVLRQLSYSLFLVGKVRRATTVINRSVVMSSKRTSQEHSTVYAAGYAAISGDVVRAQTLVDSVALASWPIELQNSYLNSLGLAAVAYIRIDRFDFADAFAELPLSAPFMQTAEYWPILATVAVLAKLGIGQGSAEARRVLSDLHAEPLPPGIGDNVPTQQLYAAIALAQVSSGELPAAERALEHVPEDSPYAAGARIALELARANNAEAFRRAGELIAVPGHTTRTCAEAKLWGAVAALRVDAAAEAWEWLSSAASTWETYGARAHVAFLSPGDRQTLTALAVSNNAQNLTAFLAVPSSLVAPRRQGAAKLTKRELVVLRSLAKEQSAQRIAEELFVSVHTVKAQLRSIYRKLAVSSRGAALVVAEELGLLEAG